MTDHTAVPAGMIVQTSPRSVADTLDRLLAILQEKQLTVFAVIDHSGEARRGGLDLRTTQVVLFGSPVAGTPVMQAMPLAALDLPLKILLLDDDGITRVCHLAPAALAERYALPAELASRLAGIDAIVAATIAAP
jgi:uncharacterized protein (DUF302 family)